VGVTSYFIALAQVRTNKQGSMTRHVPSAAVEQGLRLWASSVQKANSFPIGLVVTVTWTGSNKHFSTRTI